MTSAQMPTRIAMPCPFAGGSGAALTAIDSTEGNTVNFSQGFPEVYGTPASGGGKYVSRGEMNAIGNLASNDLFYHKCGGLNTFDPAFASAIGGYPEGAVLDYIEESNYKLFKVISLKNANNTNFNTVGIDGVNWAYLNTDNPVPTGKVLIGSYNFPATTYSEQITQIGIFYCSKSGVFTIEDSGSQGDDDGTLSTSVRFGGNGFLVKDIGTDPSATFSWPDYDNINGFKGSIGLASYLSTYGKVFAGPTASGSNWSSELNAIVTEAGHYVAVALVHGVYLTANGSYDCKLGSRTFTFYVQ